MPNSSESPLFGAVVCFTSVPPELKESSQTRYAEYAQQMGAEHKLDLTSDVTHLLVGDTDTPKYKYVAREREDVKVLKPEWIEVVRKHWIEDRRIHLDALETEYKLPPLTGLKICITGFDDLSFRAQLQKNVVENGGEYTGDLTKDVTHLVAAKPVGKKYEYGMQWQKKVVSLQWYKDTLARGMQLDESAYHPTLPTDEQGQGAWNRGAKPLEQSKKRSREEAIAPGPARKLRRTASARLGSQNSNLWGDIVGGGSNELDANAQKTVRTTKSMSVLQDGRGATSPGTATAETFKHQLEDRPHLKPIENVGGFFDGLSFALCGFNTNKASIIREILLKNGAIIFDTIDQMNEHSGPAQASNFLLMPHDIPSSRIPDLNQTHPRPTMVSELWVERCMMQKAFVPINRYPLGQVLRKQDSVGLDNIVINATGFHGLETLHMLKIIPSLGGKYDQYFNEKVSVLVCNGGSINVEKFRHAREWKIPVVSEGWLWSCIQQGCEVPVDGYMIQGPNGQPTASLEEIRRDEAKQEARSCSNDSTNFTDVSKQKRMSRIDRSELSESSLKQGGLKMRSASASELELHQDVLNSGSKGIKSEIGSSSEGRTSRSKELNGLDNGPPLRSPGTALRELSPNLPAKHFNQSMESKDMPSKRIVQTDGIADDKKADDKEFGPGDVEPRKSLARSTSEAELLNGEIRDLLNMSADAKTSGTTRERAKKKLFGRALSNLSNSSAASHVGLSRASSVDSMNTDGMGSEIPPMPSDKDAGDERGSGPKRSYTFTGRATSKWAALKDISGDLDDQARLEESLMEEQTPQMTQLGYEDPEEAIQLREKQAQRQRAKARLDQQHDDPKPTRQKEIKRIRDDDMVANAGWGAKGRTRQKDTGVTVGAEF